MKDPTRLSVLDLGSNSFHVLIADVDTTGAIVPVGREREMLHLGAVVEQHGHIPDDARERAVGIVAHLTELAGRLGAQRRLAVATSALRDAANGAEVVADMEAAADTAIAVIDGDEEARLAYRGVRASIAAAVEPVLVFDLGGGSLELAAGTDTSVSWSASLDLGVSRLSAALESDPPTPADLKALRKRVRSQVKPLRDDVRGLDAGTVVAVGGTVRAIARVVATANATWLPATINHLEVATADIRTLATDLSALTASERAQVPGMKSKRADRLHVAATILATVLETLDVPAVTVSDWGLREGLLVDAMGADTLRSAGDLRRDEAMRMQRAFTPSDPHLTHVANLAVALFDGTRDLHGMDDDDRDLLWCGAALHDIGESLAIRGHHKHGAYLIEHAELRGFTPRDTAMLASMVRFHKSRGLNADFIPYASLRDRDQRRVEQMTALLQVADGLDRARDQAVTGLDVSTNAKRVDVRLQGTGLHVARAEVDRKTALFERVFDLDVRVRDGGDDVRT